MPRSIPLVVFCLLLACSRRPLYVEDMPVRQYVKHEADLDAIGHARHSRLRRDTGMSVVVGHTDIPLTKAQPESTLGNFVADAML